MTCILSIEPNFIKRMKGTNYYTSTFCPIPLELLGVKLHAPLCVSHLLISLIYKFWLWIIVMDFVAKILFCFYTQCTNLNYSQHVPFCNHMIKLNMYSLCPTKNLQKASLQGINYIFSLFARDTCIWKLAIHPIDLCKISNLATIV